MNHELRTRLEYERKLLVNAKSRYTSRLSELSDVTNLRLKKNTRHGNYSYYCIRRKGEKSFKYLSRTSCDTVLRIKEAAHLMEAVKRIDKDISLIDSVLDGFKSYDLRSADHSLYKVYKDGNPSVDSEYQRIASEWKRDKLAYQATFPENHPENKVYSTADRTKVKTLSEEIAYDRFESAGLVTVYELPLPSQDFGPPLYPDFTILSPLDCKTEVIVEYVGMLNQRGYCEDFAYKVYRYMQNGYIPGVNLFFIFGDAKGRIDSLQINKVIADIYGLRDADSLTGKTRILNIA